VAVSSSTIAACNAPTSNTTRPRSTPGAVRASASSRRRARAKRCTGSQRGGPRRPANADTTRINTVANTP
jgi:hypothetical protein